MKTIFTILCFFYSIVLFSQWSYSSGKSDFDGKYKTASIRGSGGAFPYNKPLLVVNKFADKELSIYITDSGYSGCDSKIAYFKFNGDDKIYKTVYIGEGPNSNSWFINSLEKIDKIELLDKFIKHNYVSVRLRSNCNTSDYKFSLSGSSKALNFVTGHGFIKNYIKNKEAKIKRITEEKERLKLKRLKEKVEEKKRVDSLNNLFTSKINKQNSIPIGDLKDLKEKVKFLLESNLYQESQFYTNKTDIKVYNNIYDIEYKFILPRRSFIGIDSKYKEKNYYKTLYISGHSFSELYIKKEGVMKLFN
ncbi:hypothetical protein [Polaribacter sp.]|uniref:hypothetical protein n=1 Tax=Polaribacter sp. TaxID=1920175 RepID=UPI003F6C104E